MFNMYLLLGCCFISCFPQPVVNNKMGLKRHLVVMFVPPGFGKMFSCVFFVLFLFHFCCSFKKNMDRGKKTC